MPRRRPWVLCCSSRKARGPHSKRRFNVWRTDQPGVRISWKEGEEVPLRAIIDMVNTELPNRPEGDPSLRGFIFDEAHHEQQ